MKSHYYEVTTANTTYYVRIDRTTTIDGITRAEAVAFGGRYGVLYLNTGERPAVGCPMCGRDATRGVRTSPVRSVRRISLREFAARS
jgi:hypothetical protein